MTPPPLPAAVPLPAAPLRLRLPVAMASVEVARLAVLDFLAPHALSRKALYGLELVLEETLMNTVMHGYGAAGAPAEARITLTVDLGAQQVQLRFEDEGLAFDPLAAAPAVRARSLDEAQPGGLGLQLVRQRAQALHYERQGGRNVLTLALARH